MSDSDVSSNRVRVAAQAYYDSGSAFGWGNLSPEGQAYWMRRVQVMLDALDAIPNRVDTQACTCIDECSGDPRQSYCQGLPSHATRNREAEQAADETVDRTVRAWARGEMTAEDAYAEQQRAIVHATRNHTPVWRNGFLEGWRCAMESAKGGDWSAEYPDGW